MYDTYREHLDHEAGAASEVENCFSEAKSKLSAENADVEDCIRKHLENDLIVVVSRYPAYCHSTDAYAGDRIAVEATASSEDFLRLRLEELEAGCPDEMGFTIRYPDSLKPKPVADNRVFSSGLCLCGCGNPEGDCVVPF